MGGSLYVISVKEGGWIGRCEEGQRVDSQKKGQSIGWQEEEGLLTSIEERREAERMT